MTYLAKLWGKHYRPILALMALIVVIIWSAVAWQQFGLVPTPTPYPTSTPYPTYTPYPTSSPPLTLAF